MRLMFLPFLSLFSFCKVPVFFVLKIMLLSVFRVPNTSMMLNMKTHHEWSGLFF